MKIPVILEALDIDIDKHIQDNLKTKGFPSCLGCMYPPLVEYEPNVEITDLFVEPASVDTINIMKINPQSVVPADHADKVKNTIISKDSYDKVVKQMVFAAEHYSASVIKCVDCKHTEICNKLTTNYLKLVEISLKN
jgi:hypothetical protein